MEGDEIDRSPGLSRCIVLTLSAVIEGVADQFCRFWRSRPGRVGASDAGCRERSQNRSRRKVVELEVFLLGCLPVSDVRFVPDFPEPGFQFRIAVPFSKMMDKLKDKLRPLSVILWGVSPARID